MNDKTNEMNKKLELKHLAAYLPYSLQLLYCDGSTVEILNALSQNSLLTDECIENNTEYCEFAEYKPILRPLSDLTKEIEVGGERFVPIVKSFNQFFIIENPKTVCHNDFWCVDSFRNELRTRYSITKNPNSCAISFVSSSDGFGGFGNIPYQYELFQILLSWHFDIFGLIESNLAIDINTL